MTEIENYAKIDHENFMSLIGVTFAEKRLYLILENFSQQSL